jgi:hypothetical protein
MLLCDLGFEDFLSLGEHQRVCRSCVVQLMLAAQGSCLPCSSRLRRIDDRSERYLVVLKFLQTLNRFGCLWIGWIKMFVAHPFPDRLAQFPLFFQTIRPQWAQLQ